MVELQGKSVFSGIAIGRISVLEKGDQLVKRRKRNLHALNRRGPRQKSSCRGCMRRPAAKWGRPMPRFLRCIR